MKAQWQQLNEREQVGLLLAALCLVAYLAYVWLFAPLTVSVTNARNHWVEKNNTLTWIRQVQQTYTEEKRPQKIAAGNLLAILTDVLRHSSFHRFPYQLAQTASGEIQLDFNEVPYNAFLQWLYDQSTRYALSIKSFYVANTLLPGVVKISVTFGVE